MLSARCTSRIAGARSVVSDLAGHAPAVPALEGLDQRSAHAVAELEPIGELARRLAVRLHHLLHRAAGGGQELADHADPAQPGTSRGRGVGDEHRHRHPGEVVVVAVGEELGLVAEQLGQLARVGRAPHPGEQRGVVGRRA